MRDTIIKGCDKIGIIKVFLPTFQLAAMEANIATLFFKEPTYVEVVEKVNYDIDPTMPMPQLLRTTSSLHH
jgi:hypothetical protein